MCVNWGFFFFLENNNIEDMEERLFDIVYYM